MAGARDLGTGGANDASRVVLEGQDGWLFLQNDTNDVIGQQEGRIRLDRAGRAAWRELLAGRVALQRKLGTTWACSIVPDKEALYAEHLPATVSQARRRTVHQVLRLARRAGADVQYLLDDLAADKGPSVLYSQTDTHWNSRGSFAAHLAICRQLAARGIPVTPIERARVQWFETDSANDLGAKLSPPRLGPSTSAHVTGGEGRMIADNRVDQNGRIVIFERDDPTLPTAVMFGESFGYHLFEFFKEVFRRFVFVHSSAVIPEIVVAERPDAVLSLPIERFLIKAPVDRDAMRRFRETIRTKLETGAVYIVEDEVTAALETGGIPPAWLAV